MYFSFRFLAVGGHLSSIAYSYRLGVSTVSAVIKETTAAIWEALRDDYLKAPSRQRWQEIAQEFWTKWNYPMCVGAIDGKHVAIKVRKLIKDYSPIFI